MKKNVLREYLKNRGSKPVVEKMETTEKKPKRTRKPKGEK